MPGTVLKAPKPGGRQTADETRLNYQIRLGNKYMYMYCEYHAQWILTHFNITSGWLDLQDTQWTLVMMNFISIVCILQFCNTHGQTENK